MVCIISYLLIFFGIVICAPTHNFNRLKHHYDLPINSRNSSRYILGFGAVLGMVSVANMWLLLLWLISAAGYLIWWFYQRTLKAKMMMHTRTQIYQGCHYLYGLIQAGKLPRTALKEVGLSNSIFQPIALAAEIGADISSSLASVAHRPGYEKLRLLSQAWRISEIGGNSLALTLEKILLQLRQEQRIIQLINQELAAAQASGRMLALLPFLGLGLGFSFGGNPIYFLTQYTLGRVALYLGTLLVIIGLLWQEKLARGIK